MKFPVYCILFCISIALVSCATNEQQVLNYFGQEPPGDTPVRFAPGNVSTGFHEHSRIAFSGNGTEMCWAVSPIPFDSGTQFLKHSVYQDGIWSEPDTISFSGEYEDGSPSFSNDNEYLYFSSRRPFTSEGEIIEKGAFWRSKRTAEGWSEPEYFMNKLTQEGYASMTFVLTGDNSMFFDSAQRGVWEWSIHVARTCNGIYSEPEKLTNAINGSKINWTPFVDKDETYLIFSSNRAEDEMDKGNGDLYISFKDKTGNWTNAINMGSPVNTVSQERFPSVSPDGKYLFFARHTEENYSDIFWVDAGIIEVLRAEVLVDR